MASFSQFASSVGVETAFSVLAIAKRLIAAGKDVIELEIGDSPFATPPRAIEAGVQAIRDGHSRYGPSLGIMEFRKAAAEYVNREYGLSSDGRSRRRRSGREEFRAAVLRGVPQSRRRCPGVQPSLPDLSAEHLPAQRAGGDLAAQSRERLSGRAWTTCGGFSRRTNRRARFFSTARTIRPAASRHSRISKGLADLVRGKDVAIFSDEPYDRMVWRGRHHSLLESAGHARTGGRRLHVQQVVQHERLASGFRGEQPGDHRGVRQAHEQRALVRAAVHADGRHRRDARRAWLSRREDAGVPEEGRAARRRHEQDRRRVVPHARAARSTCFRRWPRSATGSASPHTGWRCICWKAPTRRAASPASAANALARREKDSCG